MTVRRNCDRRDQAPLGRWRPASRMILGVSAAALLTGCSSVPEEINPVEWYRGATAWVAGDETDVAGSSDLDAPAPDELPFPNLATVPERPEPTTDPGEAEAMIASLQQDRAEARVEDRDLRTEPVAQPQAASRSELIEQPEPAAQTAEPAQTTGAAPLPRPSPSAEADSVAGRFPPLQLPDVRSSLGERDTAQAGRFSRAEVESTEPLSALQARGSQPGAAFAPQDRPADRRSSAEPSPEAPHSAAPAPAGPTRDLVSVRDVSPRPPIQPPEPFSTGRRSVGSADAGRQAAAPAAQARTAVAPRPPIEPPRPYSAPRSSVSLQDEPGARTGVSLAALAAGFHPGGNSE